MNRGDGPDNIDFRVTENPTYSSSSGGIRDSTIRWEPSKNKTLLVLLFVREVAGDPISVRFAEEVRANSGFWSTVSDSDLYIWPVGWSRPLSDKPFFDEARFIEHCSAIADMCGNSWQYHDHDFEQVLVVDASVERRSLESEGAGDAQLKIELGDALHLKLRSSDTTKPVQSLRQLISKISDCRVKAMKEALKEGASQAATNATFRLSDELAWNAFKNHAFELLTKVAKGDVAASKDTYQLLRPFVIRRLSKPDPT